MHKVRVMSNLQEVNWTEPDHAAADLTQAYLCFTKNVANSFRSVSPQQTPEFPQLQHHLLASLGRQRLRHQGGSARRQRSHRILIRSLAPASLIRQPHDVLGFRLPKKATRLTRLISLGPELRSTPSR